jgi:biopolymer transport protein TolR
MDCFMAVYHRRKLMSEINVVPYIDVMLVLLIIFMITAPLLTQGVEVELPKTSSEPLPADQKQPIVLTVDAAGNYFLNIGEAPDKVINAATLREVVGKITQSKPDVTVFVRGDERADYGFVVSAMSVLQNAGVNKVSLVTELDSGG